MQRFLVLICLSLFFVQCKNNEETDTDQQKLPVESDGGIGDGAPSIDQAFTQTVEKAHHKKEFMNEEAVSFDIQLDFGGQERVSGTLTMLTNSGKIRLDKKDGSQLIFDGKELYLTPEDADDKNARFDAFTWAYFFGMPYKLNDSGTNVQPLGEIQLNETLRDAFKMTFKAGTGDSSDDWYVVYLNKDKTLNTAGYIVTFGKTKEKAEAEPHAIAYSNYKTFEGIPLATNWKFYNWTQENGIEGSPIGEANLSNFKFISPSKDFFNKPPSSKIIK